jgi:ribosomal protein S6--L-glutamate ligase
MIQIGILSCEAECYSTQRLVEAAKKRGHEVNIINTVRCFLQIATGELSIHYGEGLPKVNAVIPRIGASVTLYGTTVVRQFENMHIYTLNDAAAILRSRDKLHSLQLLAQHVPLPKTGFAHTQEDLLNIIEKMGGYPLVIKLLEGSQGKGVILAETPATATSIVDSFHRLKAQFLVQQYIEDAHGSDIRCFVIGDEVVATMQRQAQAGEFRANLHRGGKGTYIEITAEERAMAIKAAKIMGLNVAGVDILRTPKKSMVLEVNSSPGLKGIEHVSGIDIAGKIIEYIENQIKGRL